LLEGLLREDLNDGRPLVGLGAADEVRAVYRGERRVSVRNVPAPGSADGNGRSGRSRRRRGGDGLAMEATDVRLFEALRASRRERAAEQHVPPYAIFHDATLAEIARRRPKSSDALRGVSCVGQSKLQRYGGAVLELVRQH
jgi:ATP-dependent DNA helicase RecQ